MKSQVEWLKCGCIIFFKGQKIEYISYKDPNCYKPHTGTREEEKESWIES